MQILTRLTMTPVIATIFLLSGCASIALGAPQIPVSSDGGPETLISSASSALASFTSAVATATATASGVVSVPTDTECAIGRPSVVEPTTAFASGSTIYFLPVQTVTVTYYPSSCAPTASTLPTFSSPMSGSASAVTLRPTAFSSSLFSLINTEDGPSLITPPSAIASATRTVSSPSGILSTVVSGIPIVPTPLATYVVPGGGDLVEYHCFPAPTTVASTCGYTTATPISLVRPLSTATGSIPMFSTITLSEVSMAGGATGTSRPTASGDL